MPKATTIITDFVLARMPEEPIRTRIHLAHALATVAATPRERAELQAMAASLADIEHRHHQLLLNFRKRGGTS